MNRLLVLVALLASAFGAQAQENTNQNPFRQLGQELPTPNTYRTASGDKGHEYWQQQADYDMKIRLDDENQKIMEDYNIFGLPSFVFFDPDGAEVPNARVLGEMDAERFLKHLDNKILPVTSP